MSARDVILGSIKTSLKRGEADGGREAVAQRLGSHARGLIPARADKPKDAQIEIFIEQAEAVAATTQRLNSLDEAPEALAEYLRGANLPSEVKLAPHDDLTGLDWAGKTPSLSVTPGIAEEPDQVALTRALGGVAETGPLALDPPGTPQRHPNRTTEKNLETC